MKTWWTHLGLKAKAAVAAGGVALVVVANVTNGAQSSPTSHPVAHAAAHAAAHAPHLTLAQEEIRLREHQAALAYLQGR